MSLSISKSSITSYAGDVLPLHIGFDGAHHSELAKADIKWSSDSDAVVLRTFSGNDRMSFNHGVLLILNKIGTANVCATIGEECYTCRVTVREMKKAAPDTEMQYYFGDLHNHTTRIHNHEEFINRTSEYQHEFIEQIKNEGLLDLCVMSDHAEVLNDTDFFRSFIEVEKAESCGVIFFPGAESEVNAIEVDRFGITHKKSGEIVTLNTDGYCTTDAWEPFTDIINHSPLPIAIFAHPSTVGIGFKGIWDFCFHKNNTPEMLRLIRGIETVNGRSVKYNLMHEFNYSAALDAGFSVSPVASTDSHGPERGYHFMKAKTIVLAPEKSREAFVDALFHNRFYATESGNVKLKYTVNGKVAPAHLDLTSDYRFHVELSCFKADDTTFPVTCSVISDGGKTLLTLNNITSAFDFNVRSESARYFYLRLVDREGNRTWSMPIWTGRPFDSDTKPAPTPIDLSKATARDILNGLDAYVAINGDVNETWEGASGKASILIDLSEIKIIGALGYYPRIVEIPPRSEPEARAKWQEDHYTQTLPTEYAVYTSIDGKTFDKKADGIFRSFGGESIITFEKTNARYVRFDILSTVGADSLPHIYGSAKCSIANLMLFE